MNSIKIVVALSLAVVCVAVGPPASARLTDEGGASGQVSSASSPYATPLRALGGRTLAQYLADHQAGGPACCAF